MHVIHRSMLLGQGGSIADLEPRQGQSSPAITTQVYSHRMSDRDNDSPFLMFSVGMKGLSVFITNEAPGSRERDCAQRQGRNKRK